MHEDNFIFWFNRYIPLNDIYTLFCLYKKERRIRWDEKKNEYPHVRLKRVEDRISFYFLNLYIRLYISVVDEFSIFFP